MCDRCGYDPERHKTLFDLVFFQNDDGRLTIHSSGSIGELIDGLWALPLEEMTEGIEAIDRLSRELKSIGFQRMLDEGAIKVIVLGEPGDEEETRRN